jgi:hypothetical protein
MTETLDPTEWLHASYHKAYPAQMSRVKQENGKYYAIDKQNIFDYLYEKGLFGPAELSSAEFFFTLNEVATSKTGYAKMMRLLETQGIVSGGNKIPGFCPNTLMLIISQNMGKWQYAMVQRICSQDIRASDMLWINKLHNRIFEAFDELGEAIEKSIDILKQRLNNAK